MSAAPLLGIGWRPETGGVILGRDDLAFVEVVAEGIDPTMVLPPTLETARHRGLDVYVHGIRLSLGSGQAPDAHRLQRLADVAQHVGAPVISEHIAFVRAGGLHAGHLLPVPRTRDMLDVLVENVHIAQASLPVPLALEPIAALFEWPDDELDEASFLTELLQRTDALLLLDLANVFVNARNHGHDPLDLLDRLPLERVAYVHVAGGVVHGTTFHDTHAHALWPEVAALTAELASRLPGARVMLERDDNFPLDAELHRELDLLKHAMTVAPVRASA